MVNALAFGLQQSQPQDNPLSPIPSAPTFGAKPKPQMGAMDAVQPRPSNKVNALSMAPKAAPQMAQHTPQMRKSTMRSASPNALAAFMPQQKKPDAMYAFMDSLQRSVDPAGAQSREQRMTADQQTKLQQSLSYVQHMQGMPMEQRLAFAQQMAPQMGIDAAQFDASKFTDEALAASVAALSSHLGIGPTAPEFQYFQGADGAISQVDKATGAFRQINPGTPKPQAANLDRTVGANGNFWTFDPASGDMKDTGVPAPAEKGSAANWDQFTDASGQLWEYQPGVEGSERRVGVPRGRVPGADGGGSQGRFRPATPEEAAMNGYEFGQINEEDGRFYPGPQPKQTAEYTTTEIRGFRDKADGLYILNNAINQYVDTLERMGGPQLLDTPLNAENVQAIRSAHGLITAAMKQAEALGALDAGVQNLVNSIISDPVGWGTFGKSTDSIRAQAAEIGKGIEFKLSRIPEEYRGGSTGTAPPPVTPSQPKPQPTPPQQILSGPAPAGLPPELQTVWNSNPNPVIRGQILAQLNPQQLQQLQQSQLPPGVTQEMWDVMDEEDRAAFQ